MDILQVTKERKMYRGTFQDRKIERETMLQIIEAARWAPSGHNSQPWQFIIVDDKKIISDLVTIAVECFNEVQKTRHDLEKLVEIWCRWLRWSDIELEAAGDGMYMNTMSQTKWKQMRNTRSTEDLRAYIIEVLSPQIRAKQINGSPCVLFTLLDKEIEIPNFSQDPMALIAVGGAIQNLRLAIHALGLGAHEVSLLWDVPETRIKIKQYLDIPTHYDIVSAMRIGYPDDPTPSHTTHVRKPVDKLVHWNQF